MSGLDLGNDLRILLATHGFPPTHYAGAERTTERIARWLADRGHHAEVFTIERLDDPKTRIETRSENGLVIHRLYYDLKGRGDYFRNLYDDVRVGDAFKGLLETRTFDLVHIVSGYLLGGQVVHPAKEIGLPVVITLTEYWFMCFRLNLLTAAGEICSGPESNNKCMRCLMEDKRRYRLLARLAPGIMNVFWQAVPQTFFTKSHMAALERRRETLVRALAAADALITPSRFLMNKFRAFGFDMSHAFHVPHGTSETLLRSVNTRRQSPPALHVGYIGQLKHHKGIDLLIEAVTRLLDEGRQITLSLWGPSDGSESYLTSLRRRTASYPAIRWRGAYAPTEISDVYSEVDVVVVPSRWYENSPAVITEAFVMGIPVVAARIGGMEEMVQAETSGLLFEPNNTLDLRRQLERLLNEPDLLPRLQAGVPRVPTGDEELAEIIQIYKRVIAARA